jgi:Redoxin
MRTCICALFLLVGSAIANPPPRTFLDPEGVGHDPFHAHQTHVLIFGRTDCPLTNRYAPELNRIAIEFKDKAVDFWLVYSDRTQQNEEVLRQIADFHLPGTALLDPTQVLAHRAQATVSPQAAVFDEVGHLTYSGRIDDRVAELGKVRATASTHDLEEAIRDTLAHRPVAHPQTRAIGCFLADVQ